MVKKKRKMTKNQGKFLIGLTVVVLILFLFNSVRLTNNVLFLDEFTGDDGTSINDHTANVPNGYSWSAYAETPIISGNTVTGVFNPTKNWVRWGITGGEFVSETPEKGVIKFKIEFSQYDFEWIHNLIIRDGDGSTFMSLYVNFKQYEDSETPGEQYTYLKNIGFSTDTFEDTVYNSGWTYGNVEPIPLAVYFEIDYEYTDGQITWTIYEDGSSYGGGIPHTVVTTDPFPTSGLNWFRIQSYIRNIAGGISVDSEDFVKMDDLVFEEIPPEVCGNNLCESSESLSTCPQDCAVCGDDIITTEADEECDGTNLAGESCISLGFTGGNLACTSGCEFNTNVCSTCGNDVCETGEDVNNCVVDCTICGDNLCTGGETVLTCAQDCFVCGDGICSAPFEDKNICLSDCAVCGDEVCDGPVEDLFTCELDCFTCGDGVCSYMYEDIKDCPADCRPNVCKQDCRQDFRSCKDSCKAQFNKGKDQRRCVRDCARVQKKVCIKECNNLFNEAKIFWCEAARLNPEGRFCEDVFEDLLGVDDDNDDD